MSHRQNYSEATVVEHSTDYSGDISRKFNWPDLDNIQIPVTNAQTKGISGLSRERKEKLRELTKNKQMQNGTGSEERGSVRGYTSLNGDAQNGHQTRGGPEVNGRGRQVERDSVRRISSTSERRRSPSSRSSGGSPRVSRSPTRARIRSPSRKSFAEEPTEVEEELNDRLLNKTHEVKSLQRDKQVLRQRTVQAHTDRQKAAGVVDKERRNRVKANIAKYEAEQRAANVERQYKLKLARLRQIDDVWAALDEAFMTLEKQNKQMEDQKEEMDLLQEKNRDLEAKSQELESQVFALTKERDQFKEQVADLEAQNGVLQRRCEEYLSQNQDLRNRNSELESRLNASEEEAAKYKNQVTELQVDKSNLRQQVSDLNSALSEIREQRAQLERQRDDARRENDNLKREIERVSDERDRLQSQCADLEEANRVGALERERLQNEVAKLKIAEAELAQAKRKIENLQNQLERAEGGGRDLSEAIKKMIGIGQDALQGSYA